MRLRSKPIAALILWSLILQSAIGLLLFSSPITRAEQLPLKSYTTADGLAQNAINRIVRDSRGFLWFCTEDGLSRYDGYTFTNYGVEHGLPRGEIRDLIETRDGQYWIATFAGLCRFNPKGRTRSENHSASKNPPADDAMFVLYQSFDRSTTGTVYKLLEDRTGVVWCGAERGLYRLERTNGEWSLRTVDVGFPRDLAIDLRVRALVEDPYGALWIGAGSGLYRHSAEGRTERFTTANGLSGNEVRTLLVDNVGQLWVGTREGLTQLALDTQQPRIVTSFTVKNGLPSGNIRSLFQSAAGRLWVGSSTLLSEVVPQRSADSRSRDYKIEPFLRRLFVQAFAEDLDGNIWIGTDNGALKLARNGFTTYSEADGLGESRVSAIFESRAGDLGVMTIFSTQTPLAWFDGRRFKAIRPKAPPQIDYFGFGWNQLTLQDQAGDWWLPTGQGLVRYANVPPEQLATATPKAIYTTKDGLVSNDVFRLYEDSRGDIWISTFSEARVGISRWDRGSGKFHDYGKADGLPARTPLAFSFREDRAGNLWIGFSDSDALARFSDGRFTLFTANDGVPAGKINHLYLDHAGRLWIASLEGGLARVDDPTATTPRFISYTIAQGLSSNTTHCITEDNHQRIYIGTARGIDRLDPSTGRVKQFTSADGLISGEVLVSLRDRHGVLWFGGKGGLSRFVSQSDPSQSPPPVLITRLRIGGETHQISALGETDIEPVELSPNKNQIQIDFVALGFSSVEGLRYQYRLEGTNQDWSQLADERTVNFANLAPGRYRFLVQAVNADGAISETPANFSFTILPPIWQRWWFITIVAAMIILVAYSLYRIRIARFIEIERVRTRIASDLHDDIGSNLTKIAILTEVAQQQLNPQETDGGPLSSAARISRESLDSMGDIVWAINPKRDTLRELVRRMRGFATDIFTNRNIDFSFVVPGDDLDLKLGPDVRRDVFLIFKEAVNNVVRHSGSDKASIELRVEGGLLVLRISDDGRGFDAQMASDGNGLVSMQRRAKSIGGNLEISSTAEAGTIVCLTAPISHRLAVFAKSN